MKVSYCDVHWPIFPILVTVKHSGLDIELECEQEQVDQDNEATKVNPVHTLKKPKFIAEDLILYGYESIVFYIAPEDLLGSDICEKSLIQQWLSFIDQEIIPLLYAWVYPILGLLPYHAQSTEKAKKSFQQVLSTLDSHLCNHTFLVGERLTLADVLTACALLWPYVLREAL
ncbi:elongation factor 1-gamma-A-like isoform 2-T2 [Rhinophrynus dorsalis]